MWYNTIIERIIEYYITEKGRTIMAMYWYYHDHNTDIRYYTESYSMSVTEFAQRVSRILGRNISASDTSQADREKDLHKARNLEHV